MFNYNAAQKHIDFQQENSGVDNVELGLIINGTNKTWRLKWSS